MRDKDRKVLGVVSDRYKIVQNEEAFAFTDTLLGEGVRYETAGSLQGGKKVWMLAHLPHEYIISGERISPYLVFFNSHDGSGAIKAAITPIRVVCQNTLNLGAVHGKAFLVNDPHRGHSGKDHGSPKFLTYGRALHGQLRTGAGGPAA